MLQIVLVCSGNQCRSPYAAAYLRRLAPDWVSISSAGTLQMSGRRPPSDLLQLAGIRGVDISEHRSRALEGTHVKTADLVLGMKVDHVASAVIVAGADPRRSFTLGEFIRLVEIITPQDGAPDVQSASQLIERAHERRLDENSVVPTDDVEDPIGGPPSGYVAMADHVESLCDRLVHAFGWA